MHRALFALLALPGIVAGVVPALLWLLLPRIGWYQSRVFVAVLAAGVAILVCCVISFYRRGNGTLAPWDPPNRLVVEDLYRYNRNPMYIGVVLILLGWAGCLGSASHYIYAVVAFVAFHLRVVYYEEPALRRAFPDDWEDYQRQVPRWLARWVPYRP